MDKMDTIEKELQLLTNRVTRMETSLFGVNGDGGLYSEVKKLHGERKKDGEEMRSEFKKVSKFQNLMIGSLIVINIALPFLVKLTFDI